MTLALHGFAFRSVLIATGAVALAGTVGSAARAETGGVVLAEALFRDGKERLAAKDYAHACPKLAESFRLDPATGTLLALAFCHEREGKMASAWGEYADVASRSKLESRPDRENAGRKKAAELSPKVSTLTITVAADAGDPDGLEIKRNGAVIGVALLGTALPVDGGAQIIEVSAPGRKTWREKLSMASTEDRRLVRIPRLEDSAGAAGKAQAEAPAPHEARETSAPPRSEPLPEPGAASVSSALPAPEAPARGLSPLQVTGLATGAAGLVGLGVGTYFGLRAMSKNNDSKAGCDGDLCLPDAKQDRLDARSAAYVATAGFVEGGVLVSAGVAMYLLGRRSPAHSAGAGAPFLQAVPIAGVDGVGGLLRGTF